MTRDGGTAARVAVVGTGAMGTGIAQVAAMAGERVVLVDAEVARARQAASTIAGRLSSLVEKGRLDRGRCQDMADGITVAADVASLPPVALVIEAVAEDFEVKRRLLGELEALCPPECTLATNTSSLSVTALGATLVRPGRFLGLHFFNPAPVMQLVEIVSGTATDAAVVDATEATVRRWGKTPVRVASSPGFIVNRVARPYYGEAMRLLEEGCTDPVTLDALLVSGGGFRMGPCALTDLIGHDVSYAVNRSVWEACGYDPRYTPSLLQRALVESGRLGRKSGRGFFDYSSPIAPEPVTEPPPPAPVDPAGRRPTDLASRTELPSRGRLIRTDGRPAFVHAAELRTPVVVVDRWAEIPRPRVAVASSGPEATVALGEAVAVLQAGGLTVSVVDDVPGLVVTRVVSMLVNEAADVVHRGVATAHDVDVAMTLGTNYPLGPLAWGDRWSAATVVTVLDHLSDFYRDPRYRACPLLRRHAVSGRPLQPKS